jgi:hypothetical protein
MDSIQLAKKLLAWNSENLTAHSALTKANIAELFAESFIVKANGRTYDANYDNYLAFLNQFRASIKSICYDCHDFIANDEKVAIVLTAHIVRTNAMEDNFEAILILKFNESQKIILWQEVYVKC